MSQSRTSAEILSRKGGSIDWGLLLVLLVGARGYDRMVPGIAGREFMIISLALLVVMVLRQLNEAMRTLLSRRLILLMAAWMVASSLVSVRPADSLAATATALLLILYASGCERPMRDSLQTLALASLFSMIPSFVGLVLPIAGVSGFWGAGSTGGYAGYFPWNSSAGYCAAVAMVSTTILFIYGGRKWWHLPTFASGCLLLYLADSAAAFGAVLAAGGALIGIAAVRRFGGWPVTLVTSGLIAPLLIIGFGEFLSVSNVTSLFGREVSLSGRTDIWLYAAGLTNESPLFGYGSGAGIWDSERTWGSANNGYLEAALRWGLPATLILVIVILLAGYRLAASASPLLALWAVGIVANFALSQLTTLSIPSMALWLAVGSTFKVVAPEAVLQSASRPLVSLPR